MNLLPPPSGRHGGHAARAHGSQADVVLRPLWRPSISGSPTYSNFVVILFVRPPSAPFEEGLSSSVRSVRRPQWRPLKKPDAGPGPGPGARKKINPPSPSTANRVCFPHYEVRAIGVSPTCPSPICLYCLARHLWPRPPRPHCPESRRRMKSELAARGACDVEDGLFECVALSFDEQCPHAPTGGHAEARPGTLLPSARYARRAGPLSSSGACVREDRQGAAAAPSAAWAAACRSHQ